MTQKRLIDAMEPRLNFALAGKVSISTITLYSQQSPAVAVTLVLTHRLLPRSAMLPRSRSIMVPTLFRSHSRRSPLSPLLIRRHHVIVQQNYERSWEQDVSCTWFGVVPPHFHSYPSARRLDDIDQHHRIFYGRQDVTPTPEYICSFHASLSSSGHAVPALTQCRTAIFINTSCAKVG